ncbi:MAG: hemolysin family protein [Chloroflexota bacterium]
MIPIEWGLFASVLLIVLDLLIAATRVSLLNARPLRLLSLRDGNKTDVDRVLRLIESRRLRASLRLSQVLARFSLAGVLFALIHAWFGTSPSLIWFQVGGVVLLGMFMLVAEFAVEGNVIKDPDRWALNLGFFGSLLLIVFTPLVVLPLALLRSQDVPPSMAQMTEDELKTWVEAEEEPGGLEREERQMIYSIFQFGETLAREIMVPRLDMLALNADTDLDTAAKSFLDSGYSRVPVYDGSVDDILGLLYAKDLLRVMNGQPSQPTQLRELLRPAYFVPETKKADELLAEMQAQRIHMAIVVDEYGGVAGLVTLEDIVEEIIGEIQDEYDKAEELLYQAVGPDEFLFLGRIDLDDFNQLMGTHLPKDEADTLAGYLYDRLGRVPQGGEKIEVEGLELIVEQVSGRRIRRVRVCRIPQNVEDFGDGLPLS